MTTENKIRTFGVSLIFLSSCYFAGYVKDNEYHSYPDVKTEYQFNVDQSGYDIIADNKYVGRINYGFNPSLDSLIDNDNR